MRHRVYLVPGFFGFANLGDLAYFGHTRAALIRAFAAAGAGLEVHVVPTSPTASLRRRAATLVEAIADTADAGDAVHVVGHSSGGLDARLATSPGVTLASAVAVEPVMARVRSVVTVVTPHHGTPVAGFFASMMGQYVLQLLSLGTIYALRFGRVPLAVLLRLGAVFAQVDRHVGLNSLLLDQLFGQLLADFTPDRRATIEHLFADIEREQDLLPQLAPEAMDVFNAGTHDRPGVRYASVVAQAAVPGVRSQLAVGLDPSAHATHAVYQALYRLAAQGEPDDAEALSPAQIAALRDGLGALPAVGANDGVVPTLSQVWGQVIAAVRADHLDVIGHFRAPDAHPPHYDWLTTGSGFDCAAFEEVWRRVAAFLLGRPDAAG